jgi:hypothetical protein
MYSETVLPDAKIIADELKRLGVQLGKGRER